MKMIRLSERHQRVLRLFLQDPEQEWYTLKLSDAADIHLGNIHQILARFEHRLSWIESRWEERHEHLPEKRRRRRLYKLTEEGRSEAEEWLYNLDSRR